MECGQLTNIQTRQRTEWCELPNSRIGSEPHFGHPEYKHYPNLKHSNHLDFDWLNIQPL